MKLKEFMETIEGKYSGAEKCTLITEAIRAGLFNDKSTTVMLDSDKAKMEKEISDLKKICSEYQITLNAISPITDYLPLYTALANKGLAHNHKSVKEMFDLIDKSGFKICDWAEVTRLSQLDS